MRGEVGRGVRCEVGLMGSGVGCKVGYVIIGWMLVGGRGWDVGVGSEGYGWEVGMGVDIGYGGSEICRMGWGSGMWGGKWV